MERSQDLTLGLLFAGLGLAAAWQAGSYQGAGGTYPMVLVWSWRCAALW